MELIFEITNDCNLNCRYCTYSKERESGELEIREINEVLTDFAKIGDKVTITGGEPLMKEGITEILEHAVDEGLDICLLSNLTLMDEDLARKFGEIPFSSVVTSLDGGKHIQNKLSTDGSYKKITDGIKNLNKFSSKYLIVNTVLTRINRDLREIVREAINLSADRISFQMLNKTEKNHEFYNKYRLPHDSGEETYSKIRDLKKEFGEKIDFDSDKYLKLLKEFIQTGKRPLDGCASLHNYILIDAHGNVFNCCARKKFLFNIHERNLSDVDLENFDYEISGKCKKCFILMDQYF